MFSFLASFYQDVSDCHSNFFTWLHSDRDESSITSGTEADLKAFVNDNAKEIFLGMQHLMVDYRAVLAQMSEGELMQVPNWSSLFKSFLL